MEHSNTGPGEVRSDLRQGKWRVRLSKMKTIADIVKKHLHIQGVECV